MTASFLGNIILKGKLICLTGLHIGGSKEKLEIGGVDSPVIRDAATSLPYIPGSSLKGKMRALLSFAEGKAHEDPRPSRFDATCPLQRLFGTSAEERNIGPSRLIVRDAYPDPQTIALWKSMDSEQLYTELKPENSVDRLTAEANPRFLERVVKGSQFNVEFIFGCYQVDDTDDTAYFPYILQALSLLEHSTLGKNGSRGYGQVDFRFAEPLIVGTEDYRTGSEAFRRASRSHDEFGDVFTHRVADLLQMDWANKLSSLKHQPVA